MVAKLLDFTKAKETRDKDKKAKTEYEKIILCQQLMEVLRAEGYDHKQAIALVYPAMFANPAGADMMAVIAPRLFEKTAAEA